MGCGVNESHGRKVMPPPGHKLEEVRVKRREERRENGTAEVTGGRREEGKD